MSDESLQADKPTRDRKTREKRQVNYVKWGLGCTGFGMVFCTGIIVLGVIVWPVVFRSLPGEWQDRFIRRFTFMADLVPTHVPVILPTSAFKSGDAMALLATPTSTVVVPIVPTQSNGELSSGTGSTGTSATANTLGTASSPLPTLTPIPPTPTLAAPAGTPTPVVNQTPTPVPPTVGPPSTQEPVPVAFHNPGFKWVPQHWNDCGPANLTQALTYYGWQGDQEVAAAWLKPNPDDKNVSPWQMVDFVNSHTGVKAIQRVGGDLNLVKRLVSQRFAVILETGYDVAGEGWMGHYLTVVGYDDNQSTLFGMDTYLGPGKDDLGYHEAYDDIQRRWQMFNYVYIVVYTKDREAELGAILGADSDLNYNWQHALSQARYDASLSPTNPFAWFNIGTNYVLLHKYKEAATAFDQATSVGGLPWRMLWYQFTPYEAYYNVGNYGQVLALANTTLSNTIDVEETYYWKGMAEAAQGQVPLAQADLQRVLKFNPNFSMANDRLNDIQNGKFAPPAIAQAAQ